MRFGIRTMDELPIQGKTILCRVDMNQPVDRNTDTLKSTARIEACVPTIRELSDGGAKLVLMAHQGSDIEYKNYYCTRPHAKVLEKLLGKPVKWIDDVCGPAARQMIREGHLNVTQISAKLGFQSVHYFSRRFKELTGMSPREYADSVKMLAEASQLLSDNRTNKM